MTIHSIRNLPPNSRVIPSFALQAGQIVDVQKQLLHAKPDWWYFNALQYLVLVVDPGFQTVCYSSRVLVHSIVMHCQYVWMIFILLSLLLCDTQLVWCLYLPSMIFIQPHHNPKVNKNPVTKNKLYIYIHMYSQIRQRSVIQSQEFFGWFGVKFQLRWFQAKHAGSLVKL